MSSSEPRLSRPLTVGSAPELTGPDSNPLKSNVPLSTHIALIGCMLLFFVSATLITLQAAWPWWIVVVVIAIPVLVVLSQRYGRVRKARRERLELEAKLGRGRSAGAGR
ncbi:hypothetical protein SAMN04515671_0335 [Nakamurella panacisegetis]|uniref:Uncharacterized protein n=1 Tax=Nakamurella panacisegetis TaxID=1090615 RepID=A0A1H0I3B1_9ACTN|nr:hypothetical protein [Nakamurella panacisegetis]SDO25869.1 hypothetical protein SAMN04515671_0335 [Nakamurella panacisegetis]